MSVTGRIVGMLIVSTFVAVLIVFGFAVGEILVDANHAAHCSGSHHPGSAFANCGKTP